MQNADFITSRYRIAYSKTDNPLSTVTVSHVPPKPHTRKRLLNNSLAS